MREIKFRIWDSASKQMSLETVGPKDWGDYLIDFKDGAVDVAAEYAVWLQYTGLKDKNGVEIYEGDIVKFPSNLNIFIEIDYSNKSKSRDNGPKNIVTAVEYIDGGFTFDWQHGFEGPEVGFGDLEVIGNIYENPELLENK